MKGRPRGAEPEGWPPVPALADEIDAAVMALPDPRADTVRRVRRSYSRRLRTAPPRTVVELAHALAGRQRWVAYELVYDHPGGLAALGRDDVERLGAGMDGWGAVDAFGCCVSGPAWRLGRLPDEAVREWAAAADRWWRRAALVSTVPLNLRSRGGTGDAPRTLDICARLVGDRDDMVVKALSWALRALAVREPEPVRAFLAAQGDTLAARVRREVRSKLDTGLKTPGRAGGSGSGGTAPGARG